MPSEIKTSPKAEDVNTKERTLATSLGLPEGFVTVTGLGLEFPADLTFARSITVPS
jgi:hypothetical protein